jgi:hypothetical protein
MKNKNKTTSEHTEKFNGESDINFISQNILHQGGMIILRYPVEFQSHWAEPHHKLLLRLTIPWTAAADGG